MDISWYIYSVLLTGGENNYILWHGRQIARMAEFSVGNFLPMYDLIELYLRGLQFLVVIVQLTGTSTFFIFPTLFCVLSGQNTKYVVTVPI